MRPDAELLTVIGGNLGFLTVVDDVTVGNAVQVGSVGVFLDVVLQDQTEMLAGLPSHRRGRHSIAFGLSRHHGLAVHQHVAGDLVTPGLAEEAHGGFGATAPMRPAIRRPHRAHVEGQS